MPTIFSTPYPLHAETEGDNRRPALLLVNPLGTNLHVWDPMIDKLKEHHFVIRFDARGHGESRSDEPVEPYVVEDLGRDCLAILDAYDVPRASVFGASLGGLAALWMAATHPERVDRLIVASAGGTIGPDGWWARTIETVKAGGVAAMADHLERVFFSEQCRSDAPGICADAREMLLSTPDDAYIAGAEAILHSEVGPLVGDIRASTLLIFGAVDPVLVHTPAYDLLDQIPDAEAVEVAGASHRVILEQSGPIADLVYEFLADPDGR
ncbi:MAG: alpha/beta fold hydrolase [Acidimicrobiales bacterium]|nr:alpha/beta fold hydrolase [Acidimicrobiia bacterium]NNC80626.1 alpha/beta fold hydrolase [Acidimicrobiales bacterium]RZV47711.1 MAG: alpha/beta fold hydrolase [Acidimicrobiales bacterium]